VKPGSSLAATDLKRDKDVVEKYLWVNPDRKNSTEGRVGPVFWPERRAGIEVLHSTKDVAAALRECVIHFASRIHMHLTFSVLILNWHSRS